VAALQKEKGAFVSSTAEEFKAILDLAAEAAHQSERIAAPVAAWVSARSPRS
jgi:hypothetical protein